MGCDPIASRKWKNHWKGGFTSALQWLPGPNTPGTASKIHPLPALFKMYQRIQAFTRHQNSQNHRIDATSRHFCIADSSFVKPLNSVKTLEHQ